MSMNPISKLISGLAFLFLVSTLVMTSLLYREKAELARVKADSLTFQANAETQKQALETCSASVELAKKEARLASEKAQEDIEKAKKDTAYLVKAGNDYVRAIPKPYVQKAPLTSAEIESCGAANSLVNQDIGQRHVSEN